MTKTISQLEALVIGSDESAANDISFEGQPDPRLEDTFDILAGSARKSLGTKIFGKNDDIVGIVLRIADPQAQGLKGTKAPSQVNIQLLRALGLAAPTVLGARIMVYKTKHTRIQRVPHTYDETPDDQRRISAHPLFYYNPAFFPLMPGSLITGRFDVGTYQTGVITGLSEEGTYVLPPADPNDPLKKRNFSGPLGTFPRRDWKGRMVPVSVENCPDMANKRGLLNEPIISSGVSLNAYGGFVSGKESFIRKVDVAYQELKAQGISLSIGDSYRSFQTQRKAYLTKGQPGQSKAKLVAHPCNGYHVVGQAIDIEQSSAQKADILAHGPIYQALYSAGLRRIRNEWWHWSLGESDHPRDKVFAYANRRSPADTFTV
jgi:hypothetical protein